MVFIRKIPTHPQLTNYIDCYWTFQLPSDSKALDFTFKHMLPEGIFELIFSFGGDFTQCSPGGNWEKRPAAFVGGLFDQKYAIAPATDIHVLGVKFHPHAARHFFNKPLNEFRNTIVKLDDAFGPTGRQLEVNVFNASTEIEQVNLLNAFFLNQLEHHYSSDETANHLIHNMSVSNGNAPLKELAESISKSERQLRRIFNEQIGLNAKSFARILRINHFLNTFSSKENLTENAYRLGYYDQSHFVHDFKRVTGHAPSHYFKFQNQLKAYLD
jgi:AraC-like DNA-binding protein